MTSDDAYELGVLEGKRQMFEEMSKRLKLVLKESQTASFFTTSAAKEISPSNSFTDSDLEASKIMFEVRAIGLGKNILFGECLVERYEDGSILLSEKDTKSIGCNDCLEAAYVLYERGYRVVENKKE